MTRSLLSQFSRDAYLVSRAAATGRAIQNHRLTQRLVKRQYHRAVINLLHRGRLW